MSTILIVDDDSMTLRMLEYTLSGAGHTVVATASPEEAADLAAEHAVDAVILDILMPGRSGFEVLGDLNNNEKTARTPVLMLSALSQTSHRVKGLKEGADEYIGKPFDPEELILRLNRLLAAADTPDAEFKGRLETVSFAEVVQSLLHGGKTGVLEVVVKNQRGEIVIDASRAISASFDRLHGREAVLAMLELKSGSFNFMRRPRDAETTDHGVEISLQQAIFTSAWLQDEMGRWPEVEENQLLWITPEGETERKPPEGFESIPLHTVRQEIASHPGIPVKEVVGRGLAAPKTVRLAISILLHTGALRTSPPGDEIFAPDRPIPDTTSSDLEAAVGAMVHAARQRGFSSQIVHLLLVVEPALHATLLSLRQEIPTTALAAPGDSLAAAWRAGRPAELPLRGPSGQLVVHIVSAESGPAQKRILSNIADYAAVMVWVFSRGMVAQLTWLVDLVEQSTTGQWGLILANERSAIEHMQPMLEDLPSWSQMVSEPSSFDDLLDLLSKASPSD